MLILQSHSSLLSANIITVKRLSIVMLIVLLAACSTSGLHKTNNSAIQTISNADAPNFILILLDDFGWSSLSTSMDLNYPQAKSDYYRTPHMDALVNQGMRFSNGYASSPVCSPTRYSIQFGKTPARLQRTRVMGKNRVDHNQVGIPQLLKKANSNYLAAHIGKWHIDANPGNYDYDIHDGSTKNKAGGFDNPPKRQWGGYAEEDPKRVDSLTQRANAFIRESVYKERPFFLQLSHYAVHSNIVYSEKSYQEVGKWQQGELHKNRAYAAMVKDLDESIGELMRLYNQLGLADNTYLIFTSDNGGMPVLPMQANKGKPYKQALNSPLLRGKWDLMEGGIRVPFVIVGPGILAGSQSNTSVVSHDLLPTLADLVGLPKSSLPLDIDGGSLQPLLLNPNASVERSTDSLVFHFPHYNRVGMNEPHSAIIYQNYKLVNFPASNRSLLFDLSNDIGEANDLSLKYPDITTLLKNKLSEYLTSVKAENPEESNSWARIGEEGAVRTKFFQRYSKSK